MPRYTVALGARGPAPVESSTNQINPFSAYEDIMRAQNLQNENTQFQLKQQAYQALGAIAVQHPGDEEGAYREMLASQWAPWGQDYIKTTREAELTGAQIAQTQALTGKTNLEAGDSVMHVFAKNLGPLYAALEMGTTDDTTLNGLRDGAVAQTLATAGNMSESQKANAVNSMRAWYQSLYNNLPPVGDPNRSKVLMSRIAPTIASSGLDGPGLTAILGSNIHVDTPTQEGWGVQPPPYINGGAPILHAVINKGVAPKLGASGDVGYPAQGGADTSLNPLLMPGTPGAPTPGAPNQLGGQPTAPPPTGAQPAPTGAPPPAPAVPAPAPAPPSATAPQAATAPAWQPAAPPRAESDGTPLWNQNTNFTSPEANQGYWDASGKTWNWTNPGKADSVKAERDQFNTEGEKEYKGAINTKFNLEMMDQDLDRLAGTPLESGALGHERYAVANDFNSAISILNNAGVLPDSVLKLKLDPQAVAADENFLKSETLTQFSTVAQAFPGSHREAAQIIMQALKGVPDIDKSYMGNKLVLEGLKTMAHRVTEMQDFQRQWLANPANHGDLTGSVQAYNATHPAELAAQQIMQKFGLSPQGFTSQAAIANAVQHGWITPEIAADAYKKLPTQGP